MRSGAISTTLIWLAAERMKLRGHVYARVLREAINRHYTLDHLHLGDVLVALRNVEYVVDQKIGRVSEDAVEATAPRQRRVAGA